MPILVLFCFAAIATAGGGGQAPSSRQAVFEGHLEAARKAEAAQDFATAEQHYEQLVKLRAGPELWQRLGLVRHLQNNFAAAIRAFEKALELNPNAWGSHLFLGIDCYRTNQFEKALPHLQQADRLQPNHGEVRFWLGTTYLALKQDLKGLEILEEVSKEQPGNLEVVRLLAQRYSEYSVALLNDVAARYEDSPWGHLVEAQVLENEGAFEAALSAYRQALALESALEGAHAAIGHILWTQGKQQEALAEFRAELALQPQEPRSHYYLGIAMLESGRAAEARRHLEIAARAAGDSASPSLALARVELQLGAPARAAQAAARAVEVDPLSEQAHELFVASHEKAGDSEAVRRENRRWEAVKKANPAQ